MEIGFYGLRKFGRFIKRLFRWIPVLWRQEDWDYAYMYAVLKLKMQEIQKCLKEDDLHVDAPKYVRQIEICLKYMDRFINSDNYIDYPHEEVKFEKLENGCYRMITSEASQKVALKHYYFEEHSYEKFWKRFVQWHRNWWC